MTVAAVGGYADVYTHLPGCFDNIDYLFVQERLTFTGRHNAF